MAGKWVNLNLNGRGERREGAFADDDVPLGGGVVCSSYR